MSYIGPEWIEHQRRRFMRPDAQRYRRRNADRLVPRETLEALGWRDPYATKQHAEAEAAFKSEAELLEYRRELAKLRLDWELFKLSLKGQKAGFDPEQPRDDHGDGRAMAPAMSRTSCLVRVACPRLEGG